MKTNLDRVVLSLPSLLSLATTSPSSGAPRSWIQVAQTGEFVSNRYGKFSITKDDLRQMLHNFNNVTPKAPTELPVDVDHLSMDPKKPGDGIAAGWMKKLELRDDGESLYAEVEWTPQGADWIRHKAYRFISPSFVKNHTHKDGQKIGTTLLAAAITNHPFLEGMKALTLYAASAMGDLALAAATAPAMHLAEVGQRVSFVADADHTPELSDGERRQTFIVKSAVGTGDDEFVRLTTLDGREFGWFRVAQIAPARASVAAEDTTMHDAKTKKDTEQRAAAFEQRVTVLSNGRSAREAISLATTQDAEGAKAYRLAGIGAENGDDEPAPTAIDLSVRVGESHDEFVMRYAKEKGISLGDAIHEVGMARPELAAARD